MKVATMLPMIPSTVVSTNPLGLFGDGEIHRAMNPAIAPITMAQTNCMLRSAPGTHGSAGLRDHCGVGAGYYQRLLTATHPRRRKAARQPWRSGSV
jgi:hypothetical protein